MKNISSQILEIAKGCKLDGTVMTRADLAYELQDFGITEDTAEISILVNKAYETYKDKCLITSFVTNDKTRSLIDTYSVLNNIDNNVDATFKSISQHTNNSKASLQKLEKNIDKILKSEGCSNEISLSATLSGAQGAINIQNTANTAYEQYNNLVGYYETAKSDVKASMIDFIFLREHINELFIKYSMELIDIFGDSIQTVAPEIFDFDSVEWLDVKGMLDTIRLEYDTIANSCANLISSISDNFNSTLRESVSAYKSAGNRGVGLALAGLNLISHYIDSDAQTTALKQDLLKFQNKIVKDAITIKGDLGRLFVIYRTVNELYIPKADAFCKFADQVMSPELTHLIDTLYSTPELRDIKEKRDAVISSLKNAENRLLDTQLNIDIYTANCENYKLLLNSNKK